MRSHHILLGFPLLVAACHGPRPKPTRAEATAPGLAATTPTITARPAGATDPQPAPFGAPTNRVVEVTPPLRRWPPGRPEAQAIAAFLNHFVQPALGPDEAIAPLGARRVAIRANPASQAYADTLLATVREQRQPLRIEFRLLELDETDYRRLVTRPDGTSILPPQSGAYDHVRLRGQPEHDELWSGLIDRSQTLLTRTPSLRPCFVHRESDGEMLTYIQDYEVHIGNSSVRGTPILAQVLDGSLLTAQAAQLPSGAVGVAFRFEHGVVKRPILESRKDPLQQGWLPIQLPDATKDRVEDAISLLPAERMLYALSYSGSRGAERRRLLSVRVR